MTDLSLVVRPLPTVEVSDHVQDLLDLQRAAYTVEAALIGDCRIPHLTEAPADLVSAELAWHVAEWGTQIVGAIAHRSSSDGIDIDRLVVHPSWHRRGLGRMLVLALGQGSATVSTGQGNQPAIALYESLGFQHVGDQEVVPGLWVSHYRRL